MRCSVTMGKFTPIHLLSDRTLSREARDVLFDIECEVDAKLRNLDMVTRSPFLDEVSRVVIFEVRTYWSSGETVCSCQFPLDRVRVDPCAIVEEVYFNALFSDHGHTRV